MMLNPVEGEIFYIDKPLKMTSFAVVKQIRAVLRRHLGVKNLKVGHAGTLDPLATGVLTVCTGHKTKSIDQLQASVKEYVAGVQLGETTPSFDMETAVDATCEWRHITREEIERVLREQFTGAIEQVPPSFSACKVGGKPAYKLARRGQEVEMRAKTLVIDAIELLECGLPDTPHITIRVVCSKGTYIRALARDIGEALNSGAHLTSLRRTRVGDVTVESCEKLDDLLHRLDGETYVSAEEAERRRIEAEREANRAREAARKARKMRVKASDGERD